ncbi:MAG: hypothetical protein ABR543_17345 [Gemmatimonadaceae bacterium]
MIRTVDAREILSIVISSMQARVLGAAEDGRMSHYTMPEAGGWFKRYWPIALQSAMLLHRPAFRADHFGPV